MSGDYADVSGCCYKTKTEECLKQFRWSWGENGEKKENLVSCCIVQTLGEGDHITADPHEAARSSGESKQIYFESHD